MKLVKYAVVGSALLVATPVFANCNNAATSDEVIDCIINEAAESDIVIQVQSETPAQRVVSQPAVRNAQRGCSGSMSYARLEDCIVAEGIEEGYDQEYAATALARD